VIEGPVGRLRRRDSALLEFTVNDAVYWHDVFVGAGGPARSHELLTNPSISDVALALTKAIAAVDAVDPTDGQIDFVFTGHGSEDGGLVLRDGTLSAAQFAELFKHRSGRTRLLVGVVLDCCYAGRWLAELLTDRGYGKALTVVDGFAACLPNQFAFELEALGHGVLTYTMKARKATGADLRLAASVPSVMDITGGEQTDLDVISGWTISVRSGNSVQLQAPMSLRSLLSAIDKARSAKAA
jgi:hypothetical protein